MPEILVAGETLVDFLPESGTTLRDVDAFAHRPGGAPANVAVGLARLGSPPAFWTRLGDDPFGEYLAATLAAEGVPDAHVERVDGTTTLAVGSPSEAPGPRFNFYGSRDATFGFDPDAVPANALASEPWVHLGGVALTHPRGRGAMAALVSEATARGCPVSFDINYRPDLVPDGDREAVLAAVHETVAASDVVLCSDEEAAAAGLSTSEGSGLARDLLDRGPHTAVVTMGADGALAAGSDAAPWGAGERRHPGFAVDAADATGAGDAFAAGLLSRLAARRAGGVEPESGGLGPKNEGSASDGDPLAEALAFANATAALSVRAVGGMAALPSRAEVESFLAKRE